MKPTHTPGLLKLATTYAQAQKGHAQIVTWEDQDLPIATIKPNHLDPAESLSNAERFVACWNACDGINPAAVPEIVDALERLLHCACPTGMDTETDRAMEQARAALAKAKA